MSNEQSPAERLTRSWDANAMAWAATVREGRIESRRLATDRAIVEAVLAESPGRVLDVGCGEGWLCRALHSRGVRCTGVDGSADLIEAARTADPDGEYRLLRYDDFDRLAEFVETTRYDVAVCNFSLLHEEIRPILTAVAGVLRSGGTLLVQTVHPWTASGDEDYADGWRTEAFSCAGHSFPQAMPWYFRTLQSWIDEIRASGFGIHHLAEPLHPESRKPLSLVITATRRDETERS